MLGAAEGDASGTATGGGDKDRGDGDDDTWPPPIPAGFQLVEEYEVPQASNHILYFSKLTRKKREVEAWHRFVIVQELSDHPDGWTHDAYLFGESAKKKCARAVDVIHIHYIVVGEEWARSG